MKKFLTTVSVWTILAMSAVFGQNHYQLTFDGINQMQVKQLIGQLMPVFNSYPTVSDDFKDFRYETASEVRKEDVDLLLKELDIEMTSFSKKENE